MTIKERLLKLYDEFAKTSDAHLKANKKLSEEGNGFFDKKLLDDFAKTKLEWQNAANAYHSYLSNIINNKINVEAEE
ncbi:hypothetical protein [Pedobacter xixiisoli]|uniref:Uncharacterized protein n=1 Tax=Pedobacter xixiisoli TaxID=1476464 RepID=A0A286A6Z3_9SPHI|nr:hypothetical protein [Pedobacter xixiisoli]SOD17703.1 hypothetical protein SAMN06297358_2645 [Pedobacter xixiisoli]